MRDAYIEQLDSLFDDLAAVCDGVDVAVRGATVALLEGSVEAAERVISADAEIDRARDALEEKAFELLLLQQPVARDLRSVVAALRMVTDLERMGDLAVHVAKIARMRAPELAVPADVAPTVERMAEVAQVMVRRSAEIIRERDADGAHALVSSEEEMDQLRRTTLRELLSEEWAHGVEAAVDLALLGRYFERIGDHALGVAKRIGFVVTGETADVV